MTSAAARSTQRTAPEQDVSRRLLDSSATLSYDPATEIDWDAPLPEDKYGLNPEWSTLYGTPLWDEMSEAQRVTLTRHEVCSIMSTGIWFEMILQQMILRDQYVHDPANAEFQFALTEIADECRHSIMFARTCEKLGVPAYFPHKVVVELARVFKSTAGGEVAYGGTLVAEEVLDVMQRDWMRGENVLDIVRTSSKIHVVEESRHMKFARQEIREHMEGISPFRRRTSATTIAAVAYVIVRSLVNPGVYRAAGLDTRRAVAAAASNQHRKSMMRNACAGLMEFLSEAGLLNRPAVALYQRVHMI
ncbi:AurF N-oxygenase family protein [Amycolatopsis anabasis]|uniref:AurF N-oxygenase family protein n=1 Tax=Amycolatopsis anabasis TaxID=1840409 RepID=UPI00131B135D|nr:diiron oxygenase [Amycolatopsis anabasis]